MAFFYALPITLGLLCALPVALVLLCALLYVRLSKSKIAVAILTQDNNNFEKIRIELNQKIDDLFQEKSILQKKR